MSNYSKYNAKRTTVDGITFDSKKEANRYKELKMLLKAKKIKELELQPKFELQPHYKRNGKTVRAITYIADFMYLDTKSGKWIIEDVKGARTEVFNIKKKMLEYRYPDIELRLV